MRAPISKTLSTVIALSACAWMPLAVQAPAIASDTISPASVGSCPELGTHTTIVSSEDVFIEGDLPRIYGDPGSTLGFAVGKHTTVSSSINGTVSADFFKVASASLGVEVAQSFTVTAQYSFSWVNDTSEIQWAALGSLGKRVEFKTYDVVPPCEVTNETYGNATLATASPYFKHS